ncbi:MAG: hypothetical protein IPO40_07770 [Fibrobacteres bacterium]|nr:hypothetical protein [Fibrobacterota bacterium]
MSESRRHLYDFLDSRFGPQAGLNADWCCRCWKVGRSSECEEIWLFDEESPDLEFTLLSRKEGDDAYITTELASGTLRELRAWSVSHLARGPSDATIVLVNGSEMDSTKGQKPSAR